MLESVSATVWATKIRKTVTLTAGMIAALLGAWTAIKANADDLEHFYPASRPYARIVADEKARAETKRINDAIETRMKKWEVAQAAVERSNYHIRHELADGKREQAEDNLFKTQRDLKAANHALEIETDPKNKAFIESTVEDYTKQVNKLEATKRKIEQGIDVLEKEKPKGD